MLAFAVHQSLFQESVLENALQHIIFIDQFVWSSNNYESQAGRSANTQRY